MTTTLATVNLEVSDIERSRSFYVSVLGMTENRERSRPPTFAYLESAGCALTITTPTGAHAPQPSPTMELGFATDDLAGAKARLEAAGVAVREDHMGWGSALELRDPDGYRVIVYRLGPSPFAGDGLGA